MSDENGQALVAYEPKKAISSPKTAKALLGRFQGQIAQILPRHMTPERMLKLVLVAVNRTPKLLKCTQESVIESVMRSAELGLDCSGTLGEAYLVPYGNTCQFIPGYKGLVKLARQSGELSRIEAEVVHEHDDFDYQKGSDFKLVFRPNFRGDRGEPIGAYALIEFKDGGMQSDFMTVAEIEAVRQKSPGRNSGPWKDHWDEMARKTVWRRLSKWAPLSYDLLNRAIEYSDEEFARPAYTQSYVDHEMEEDINEAIGLADPSELTDEEKEEYGLFEDEAEEE